MELHVLDNGTLDHGAHLARVVKSPIKSLEPRLFYVELYLPEY